MRIYRVAKVHGAERKPFVLMTGDLTVWQPLQAIGTYETKAEALAAARLLAGWRHRVEWVDWRGRAYVVSEGRP